MSTPVQPLRLHLGGWERRDGWKILDIQASHNADFIGNCQDLSQFDTGSVTEIYASHIYEHLNYNEELPRALAEAFRVLKPGGLMRIGVPDLEALARLILDKRISLEERFEVQRMIFGGQTDDHDYHKVGLTFDFLKGFLERAGFRGIQRIRYFDLFQDATALIVHNVPISLNVSAMKPL
jgi:predicted SAM-dependent methyltransferase